MEHVCTRLHPAIRYLQKNGRSNHRNDDHYGSYDQPVSPASPCLRRPICVLLLIVCGSLCCPSGLFFLLGFIMFRHCLPLYQQGSCRLWSLAVWDTPPCSAVMSYTACDDTITVPTPAASSPSSSPCSTCIALRRLKLGVPEEFLHLLYGHASL